MFLFRTEHRWFSATLATVVPGNSNGLLSSQVPGFLHSLSLDFIDHGSVGYPIHNPGAPFLSFLISQHQPVSAGHPLAIPFSIPRANKQTRHSFNEFLSFLAKCFSFPLF